MELPVGKELYNDTKYSLVRLNCGRAALYYAIKDCMAEKIYIPFYICSSIIEPIKRLGIKYDYYSIDEDFVPINLCLKPKEYILWVNYYGAVSNKTIEYIISTYKNLILDNTHAFFYEPVIDVYNVYSCRKFFGVSDGGYLIKNGLEISGLKKDISYEKIYHRLKYIDIEEDKAFIDEFVHNELTLGDEYLGMSNLTQIILSTIDYEKAKNQRIKNYLTLYERLKKYNSLNIEYSSHTPMVYPLLSGSKSIIKYLYKRNIIAVNWWNHVSDLVRNKGFEHTLAQYLIQLPIDQRYDENDMIYIANTIDEYFRVYPI